MCISKYSKRSRLSVVVDGLEYVEGTSNDNGTHVLIEGGSNIVAVHKRSVVQQNKQKNGNLNKSRITWKSPAVNWKRFQFWEPRIVDGYNYYSDPGHLLNNGIVTPKYSFYHGVRYEGPEDIEGIGLDWTNCDIDIRYGPRETVVDQWCSLSEGNKLIYGKNDDTTRAEFGMFNLELDDGIDVGLEGMICKWNETEIEKCQKSLSMFKKSHTFSNERVDVRLIEPAGMHPTLEIDLQEIQTYGNHCEIFMYLTLPKGLFVDKFGGHATDSVTPLFVSGITDLEKPSYQLHKSIDGWGSEILYRLSSGELNKIELHSRYSEPKDPLGKVSEHVAMNLDTEQVKFKPVLFQACDTGLSNVGQNPFYSKALGYEAYFTDDTVFHHYQNSEIKVKIPAAHWHDYQKTQWFTGFCLLTSVFYLFYKLLAGSKKNH